MRVGRGGRALREVIAEVARVSPRKAALGILLLLVLTFAEGAGLLLMGPLLEQVVVIQENPLPRAGGWLSRGLAVVGLEATLGSVLTVFVALAVVRALAQHWRSHLLMAVREEVVTAYRTRLYRAIAAAEWRFLVTRAPSLFVHALTGEVGRVGQVVSNLTELTVAVLVSLVYLVLAFRLAPLLATMVLVSGLVLSLVVRRSFDQARLLGAESAVARQRLHQTISEQLASLKTARVYGAVARQIEEVERLSSAAHEVSYTSALADSHFQQGLEVGSTVLLAVMVFVSVTVLEMPPALLLVLMFVFARLMPRLIQSYRLVRALTTVLPIVDDLNTRLRECTDAAETTVTAPQAVSLRDSIEFDRVSFAYLRRADQAAVVNLDLRIAAGMTTAIVGSSGSGKSTVADLLVGLLAPTTGRILVDGTVLGADRLESWRRQIGYVPQDTFLFHDSVRANLAWARADATEPELWEALRMAAADDFVAGLPDGLDTVIGERGVLLSGGERQRVSIARALLRRPAILLLDEATSSLDVVHEQRIQDAIERLHHRLTVVIITHRLTTIRHADVIHVMQDGAVTQSGTWEELRSDRSGRFETFLRSVATTGAAG